MTPFATNQPSPVRGPVWKEQPLNFKKTISRIFSNARWFLLSLLLSLFLAFLLNQFARPVYEARTTLLFETDFSPATGNEALGSDVFQGLGRLGSMRNIYDQSVMIVSTPLVEQVLDELGYEVSYYSRERHRTREIYTEVPFSVTPDPSLPQAVEMPFEVEISREGKFRISARGKKVSLYDYNQSRVTGMVPEIRWEGTFEPGTLVTTPHFAFTITPGEEWASHAGRVFRFVFHTRQELLEKYKSKLVADIPEEKSSIVELSVSGNNIAKAIAFLDRLTQVYQEDNLERKNNNASRTIDFISAQLQSMSDSLMISQNELQQFRARTQVMDLSLQTPLLLEQMNTLDQEKMILETKNKYYAYLKEYIGSNQDLESIIAPSAMGVDDPLLNNLVMELNRLVVNKSSMPAIRNADHPQLRAINAQIEQIKSTLLENANSILAQSQISLADLNSRLRVAQARVNALPATERNYVNIERKYKLNNEILTFLLQKFSEAQIAKASNLPDSQVIEPAYFNRIVFPKPMINYFLALFLAILVPLFILYLKDYFSDIVNSEEDIRAITPLPILGNIYRNKKVNDSATLVLDKPNCPASELYRAIRGKLSLVTADRKTPVIAVTSTFPNEGKTYSAINIASSFALMKKKTVLVDFDLRNSVFGELFGLPGDKGLIGYIKGESSLPEITFPSKHPFLALIPAGPKPPDPGDILAGDIIFRLLEELRHRYEMVIIDNLPVGLVADLFQLREEIDAVVFVVRHGFTRRSTLKNALSEVTTHQMKNVGILVNGIENNKQLFGYGYNNDYIYGNTEKEGRRIRSRKKRDGQGGPGMSMEAGEVVKEIHKEPGDTGEKEGKRERITRSLLTGSRSLLLILPAAVILLLLLVAVLSERGSGERPTVMEQPEAWKGAGHKEQGSIPNAAMADSILSGPGTRSHSSPSHSANASPGIHTPTPPGDDALSPRETAALSSQANGQGKPLSPGMTTEHPRPGLFYVIGKSLETPEKAEEYLHHMAGRGYHPLLLGKIGKYHFVALETYLTEKEALEAVKKYRESKVAEEAWVYRHR